MIRPAILMVLLIALSSLAAAQEQLTALQVIDKCLVAMGGERNLTAVQTETATGEVELLGGFPGKFALWAKAPNKTKTSWDIGYIRQERAFDGNLGWEKNAAIRELAGLDLVHLKRASLFNPLLTFAREHVPATLKPNQVIPRSELPFRPSFRFNTRKPAEEHSALTAAEGRNVYVVEFRPAGEATTFYIDAETFLPLRQVYTQPYEEGAIQVMMNYGDYRRVGNINLPFAITEVVPDLPLVIHITQYALNVPIDDSTFRNPQAGHAKDPYEVTLDTIPRHAYKENDGDWSTGWNRAWGIPFVPTESWLFNLLVNEKFGRHVALVSASLEFYSDATLSRTVTYTEDALKSMQKFPVTRFSPQPEIFDLRFSGSEPTVPEITRLICKIRIKTPSGDLVDAAKEIALTHYQQKAKLIFPIKGNFIVTDGHEFYELGHKYEWSQHYGYDIVGLGINFDLKTGSARRNEDFVAYATREILAPADGVVAYARNNDVPDDMDSKDYLRTMPDPITAIGGNLVIIDHGNGEYSLLAHMHKGSVRVKTGDKVKQGQVIALMGSAGSPGAPHLHYQLQAGPGLFSSDGLPSQFENLEWSGWFADALQILTPKRGVYLTAK